MKATTFIAILLTMLMALLVLIAAVIFLLQGRQQLETRANAVATERAELEGTRVQLEANLGSESTALLASQAQLNTRDAEFISLSSQVIQLEQELDAATAALATALQPAATPTPDAEMLAAPTVEFISPRPDEIIPVNTPAEIVFIVYHAQGIGSVHMEVGEEVLEDVLANGEQFRRFNVPYEFSETEFPVTQPVVISIVATSTLGIAGEPQLLNVTVSVPTPVPTATPTPTTTSGIPTESPMLGTFASAVAEEDYFILCDALADPRQA